MKIKDMRGGKPVPLSDTELIAEAVKDAFCGRSTPEARRIVTSVQVENFHVQSGRQDVRKPDPRTFIARGKVHYKLVTQPHDRLVRVTKPAEFNITFRDSKDDLGQPDTAIDTYAEKL